MNPFRTSYPILSLPFLNNSSRRICSLLMDKSSVKLMRPFSLQFAPRNRPEGREGLLTRGL